MELIKFQQSDADPCVYVQTEGSMTVVAVYVDDLILIAETMDEMKKVKESLATKFRMTDMGKLHYCLGITIICTRRRQEMFVASSKAVCAECA